MFSVCIRWTLFIRGQSSSTQKHITFYWTSANTHTRFQFSNQQKLSLCVNLQQTHQSDYMSVNQRGRGFGCSIRFSSFQSRLFSNLWIQRPNVLNRTRAVSLKRSIHSVGCRSNDATLTGTTSRHHSPSNMTNKYLIIPGSVSILFTSTEVKSVPSKLPLSSCLGQWGWSFYLLQACSGCCCCLLSE